MKHRGQTRAGLGAASMVLILLVLCLALLGVLSMMTARNDLSMSRRDLELSVAYAQAADAAQQALMALDEAMTAVWRLSENEAQYLEGCMALQTAGEAELTWLDEKKAQMVFDAGADRQILVEIERNAWEVAGNKRFSITKHTLEDTYEWGQTEGLLLMGM